MSAPNPPRAASPSVRLAPLPADALGRRGRLGSVGDAPRWRRNPENAGNALATLVHHPALITAFLPLNVHLLFSSTLSPRLRELAILRVAHRRGSDYEWAHHVDMGRRTGLTDDDIAACRRRQPPAGFDGVVLRAVDELHERRGSPTRPGPRSASSSTTGSAWTSIFTVGTYSMLAMAFNTFGVELDHDHDGNEG